jgi:hypothetical protein
MTWWSRENGSFSRDLRTYFLGKKTYLLEASNTFCRKNTYLLPKDLLVGKMAHYFRKITYFLEKIIITSY